MTAKTDLLLEQILEQLVIANARRTMPPPDIAKHLKTIYLVVGDRLFTSAELVAHAALPQAADLRSALISIAGTCEPKRIGHLFKKIAGVDYDGLQIVRVRVERDGVVWRVECLRI